MGRRIPGRNNLISKTVEIPEHWEDYARGSLGLEGVLRGHAAQKVRPDEQTPKSWRVLWAVKPLGLYL